MTIERINQLHEQASERYLNGDYQGALEAWRDVLGLDAANEQAQEGVHLASQFVEPSSQVFAEATPEVEQELEQGLKVLDGLRATTLLHPDMADGATDRKPGPQGDGALATEDALVGWDTPTAPVSAAASELKRRVDQLLEEATHKADAGERDEALVILSRLAILDEENADAAVLRSKIEAEGATDLDKIELAIIEGVAALEADNLDEAERRLNDALKLAPEHREARHYLDKVAERRASGGEEPLSAAQGESAPPEDAVQRAVAAEAVPRIQAPAPKPPRPAATAPPEPPEPPPARSGPRFALLPPKLVLFGGVGAAALACAAIALPHLFGGAAPKTSTPRVSAPNASVPLPPRAHTVPSGPLSRPGPATPAPTPAPVNPEERARVVASGLASGHSMVASGDFGGAVLVFNETLKLDPGNAEAKAGIADAGERYKASKAERDALSNIKFAFRDGEFSSGLRLAYRLPPSVSASYVDGVKLVGWYNLAVVALRAGDCTEALSHLDEALQAAPSDVEARKLREFASRYVEAVKDRVFLDRVESLAFRPLPAS